MKERPILFSAPMVRAILDGRKTQTRRALRYQPSATPHAYRVSLDAAGKKPVIAATWISGEPDDDSCCLCPYGVPGDRLWVRETWCQQFDDGLVVEGKAWYRADGIEVFKDDGDGFTEWREDGTAASPWRPSIHMPRWASRITLEVTGVRVERLQDISEADAFAEGITGEELHRAKGHPPLAYRRVWESINGAGSWDANPWVWVVEFRKVA